MSLLVVDASIAIKWVIDESGSNLAIALRAGARFVAPDLLNAELGNILYKKVVRGEVQPDDAEMLAILLTRIDIDLRPTKSLLPAAVRLAVKIEHPTYDCFYLALALSEGCQFVTADAKLLHKLDSNQRAGLRRSCLSLKEAATR